MAKSAGSMARREGSIVKSDGSIAEKSEDELVGIALEEEEEVEPVLAAEAVPWLPIVDGDEAVAVDSGELSSRAEVTSKVFSIVTFSYAQPGTAVSLGIASGKLINRAGGQKQH